jgi:hypothetical protein
LVLGCVLLDARFNRARDASPGRWHSDFSSPSPPCSCTAITASIRTTPRLRGVLICAAYTCWLWAALLSFVIDRLGVVRPLNLFIRGGQNVLLAYLLHPAAGLPIRTDAPELLRPLGAISPAVGITRSLVAAGADPVAGGLAERPRRAAATVSFATGGARVSVILTMPSLWLWPTLALGVGVGL